MTQPNVFKKEPAVLIGVVASALAYVQEEIQTVPGQALSWKTLLPLLVSAVVRFFVYSPATYQKELSDGGNS